MKLENTIPAPKDWSPTSLKEKLIKIGAKVVSHGRFVAFQMAEVAIPPANVPGDFAGCEATYQGDQPANWRHLLIFWSPRPIRAFADIPGATWDRDRVLCPEHAAELEAVLKLAEAVPPNAA